MRSSLISEVVTKGLNPDVPMKDSTIDWIGEIPSHWDVVPLKRVVEVDKETLTSTTPPDLLVNYVEIGDVNERGEITGSTPYRFKDSPSRCRKVLHIGDVFISTVRTYLKSIGLVTTDGPNLIGSTGFSVLTPLKTLTSGFLFRFVSSDPFVSMIVSRSDGVSYPAIQSSRLVGISILVPPITEQEEIVSFLNDKTSLIEEEITREETSIEYLNWFRQSLIHEVVTGNMDVRGIPIS